MSKRLGRFAGMATLIAICSAAVFVVPITLFNVSPFLSALFVLVLFGAFAAAWLAEFMYRKAFPNQFRAFEKNRPGRRAAGEGDE